MSERKDAATQTTHQRHAHREQPTTRTEQDKERERKQRDKRKKEEKREKTRRKTPERKNNTISGSGGYREGIGQGGPIKKCARFHIKIARRSLCNPCRALRGLGCPQITNRLGRLPLPPLYLDCCVTSTPHRCLWKRTRRIPLQGQWGESNKTAK